MCARIFKKNLVNWPLLIFHSYGNPCRSQSPSTSTRRSDILLRGKKKKTHKKGKEKKKPDVHTILSKVMTSVLCLKITKTGMDDWTTASRWSNRWMRFPSPNLQERHGSSGAPAPDYSTNALLLKDTCLSCKRWSVWGERWVTRTKKKEKWNLHSLFPLVAAAAAATADGDDVDQRKVTEGKMHIEKALGNIWCRRQSRLYHSSGGGKKKQDAEKYGWPLLRQYMYQSVGFISKMPICQVHLPPLPGFKWRLGALSRSAPLLLETLNTFQSSPRT